MPAVGMWAFTYCMNGSGYMHWAHTLVHVASESIRQPEAPISLVSSEGRVPQLD